MPQNDLEITPSLTVHDLLETYPQLEEELISIAPPFEKLRNPFLKRSVAKIATMKHIASVGGLPLDDLIAQLRQAVGQQESAETYDEQDYFGEQPDWFSPDKVVLSIDEDKLEDKDKMTLVIVLHEARKVHAGEIIELVTSFLPAPGIDILKSKGYQVWTIKQSEDLIRSYFLKPAG